MAAVSQRVLRIEHVGHGDEQVPAALVDRLALVAPLGQGGPVHRGDIHVQAGRFIASAMVRVTALLIGLSAALRKTTRSPV